MDRKWLVVLVGIAFGSLAQVITMGTPAGLERTITPHSAHVGVIPLAVKSFVINTPYGEQVVAFSAE
jgi:hypothetical protein